MATKNRSEATEPPAPSPDFTPPKGSPMASIIDYILLADRIGRLRAASTFRSRLRGASFTHRLTLGIWIAGELGHELENPPPSDEPSEPIDPDNEPPLDDVCLFCRRRVYVAADRPGMEGSALEAECLPHLGSRAQN